MGDVDSVRPTDIAPMSKKVIRVINIKIEVRGETAFITSKDGEVNMTYPASAIAKRMPRGLSVAFFKGQISSTVNAVEICDRVELPPKKQW